MSWVWGEKQKIFYTRGTIRGIKNSPLAKIYPLFMIAMIELRKGLMLELHRMEEGFIDICCITQDAALFVSLF